MPRLPYNQTSDRRPVQEGLTLTTRNELLVNIVEASGGGVRNPNNRNMLLEDWLEAAGGIPALTRSFTTFDATANMYIELDSAITLAGGFRVALDATLNSVGDTHNLFAEQTLNANNFSLDLTTSGTVRLGLSGGLTVEAPNPADGRLYSIICERVGTTVSLTVNGVTNSASGPVTDATFFSIGRRNTLGRYFQGIIANVQIEDNGTLVGDFPIDGANYDPVTGDDTVTNKANPANNGIMFNANESNTKQFTKDEDLNAWLGGELWDQGSTLNNGQVYFVNDTLAGNTYLVEISGADASSNIGVYDGATFSQFITGGSGTVIVNAIGGGNLAIRENGPTQTGVSVSVKQIIEIA